MSVVDPARPAAVVTRVLEAIEASERPEAWLHVAGEEALARQVAKLERRARSGQDLPLFGMSFAVKDNIDVAGMPTTAGCPAFAYVAERSATVVDRLVAAGALVVGKTHMDQFATGLVGTRSPHGPCRNPHAPEYIAGGSSSGSAVVVAQGIVDFALGTDTAGSGRVPAAMCGVLGFKPTRGRWSAVGVVPACASLDCVSVFTRTPRVAARVARVAEWFDAADPFARPDAVAMEVRREFRFGVPVAAVDTALDDEDRALFAAAVERFEAIGGTAVPVDYGPFAGAAELLYAGPWVAERQAAFGEFIAAHPHAVDATVAAVVAGANRYSARDAFAATYELRRWLRRAEAAWRTVDALLVPAVPRAYRIAEVLADPLGPNTRLGTFNNFVNLLDLAAVAIPTGVRRSGVPFGATLVAPAFSDSFLLDVAARWTAAHADVVPRLEPPAMLRLVVAGAHMSGMPLNPQLVAAGGRLERAARTRAGYRMYALAGTQPPKPGLVRVDSGGAAIEVEVWRLPAAGFARFVAAVPQPLVIGRIDLDDGASVPGFLCEPVGLTGARDITELGGWRAWVASGGIRC